MKSQKASQLLVSGTIRCISPVSIRRHGGFGQIEPFATDRIFEIGNSRNVVLFAYCTNSFPAHRVGALINPSNPRSQADTSSASAGVAGRRSGFRLRGRVRQARSIGSVKIPGWQSWRTLLLVFRRIVLQWRVELRIPPRYATQSFMPSPTFEYSPRCSGAHARVHSSPGGVMTQKRERRPTRSFAVAGYAPDGPRLLGTTRASVGFQSLAVAEEITNGCAFPFLLSSPR